MLLTSIVNTCYNGVMLLYFLSFFLGFMYNLQCKCLMKCLNEFFIDCLMFYCVDLKQWTIKYV